MGQSWTKSDNFGSVPISINLFARALPLGGILAILDHIGGVRAQKRPKNGYFGDAK